MSAMAERKDGSTWINIEPDLDDETTARLVDRSGVAGWFSGRGSDMPVATYMAVDVSGRKPQPSTVGIQHSAGPKAIERLAAQGIVLPEGCVVQQDSGKRGLVVAIPERIAVREILDFLTAALGALLPPVAEAVWFRADIATID